MTIEKAILIASNAHQGQLDKGGQPYILHPLRLMLRFKDEKEQICAVLHDVVEDTTVSLENLKEAGFAQEIIEAIDALTKRKGEKYEDYIKRVIKNELACQIKLADLRDNMDLSRIKCPTEKDYARTEKYSKALNIILDALDFQNEHATLEWKEIEIKQIDN